jgi:PKHD-type hydroxylase
MLIHLKSLLGSDELKRARTVLEARKAPWVDGRLSAGVQAAEVKRNEQLATDSPQAIELRTLILQAVQRDPIFYSACLPRKILSPQFNRYHPEAPAYGAHLDNAVMRSHTDGKWVRTDISCTVFLSEPEEYDGGELTIHDTFGTQRVKLPAGDAILYSGSSLHEVAAVTRGTRLASFFWIESMVRDEAQRRLLFALDMNLLKLRQELGETAATTALTGVYHNLIRMWAMP